MVTAAAGVALHLPVPHLARSVAVATPRAQPKLEITDDIDLEGCSSFDEELEEQRLWEAQRQAQQGQEFHQQQGQQWQWQMQKMPPGPPQHHAAEWIMQFDQASGHQYYLNTRTGEAQWQ